MIPGQEDPLEEEMAALSSILPIDRGRLQPIVSRKSQTLEGLKASQEAQW